MFYYIDKPHNPSVSIGLVKSESDFIFRSVETDSGKWTLMVAVISDDAYPFLSFTVLPDSKKTKLGSSYQEASPSADENTGVDLVPCCACKCNYF